MVGAEVEFIGYSIVVERGRGGRISTSVEVLMGGGRGGSWLSKPIY